MNKLIPSSAVLSDNYFQLRIFHSQQIMMNYSVQLQSDSNIGLFCYAASAMQNCIKSRDPQVVELSELVHVVI